MRVFIHVTLGVMKTQKITVAKDDMIKDVMGSVAAEDARQLIFVIPRGSRFAEAPDAFAKLKKVADALNKTIAIESVDDTVLGFAKAAGIEAINPFFESHETPTWEEPTGIDAESDSDDDDADMSGVVATPVTHKLRRGSKHPPKPMYRRVEDDDEDDDNELMMKRDRGLLRNKWVWAGFAALVAVPLYMLVFRVLPRAEIRIITEKTPWMFNNIVAIEKNGSVPSRVIAETKNAQMVFPSTGKKNIAQKARGKIIVYNGYSSQPQQLVATTRFATSDGLIVRLAKNIMIPGAKIESSNITASSIEAEVIADKPGTAYNIGPVAQLTIPGFKGTARFEGFYGEIKIPLSGGFAGESPYPTDQDIVSAKTKIGSVLREALEAQLDGKSSLEYTIVKGSSQFAVTKTEANNQVNAKGEFSVFAEGKLTTLAFKESDLLGYLAGKMKHELGETHTFKEAKLSYDIPKIDFNLQKMSLPVDLKGMAERPVDIQALRAKVAGATERELKVILFAVPGVERAEVTFWPGYVSRVPSGNTFEKLTFTVQ